MVCLNEAMFIGCGIIKNRDVVDAIPDKYPGNIILAGTGWAKKVYRCNNGSTARSLK